MKYCPYCGTNLPNDTVLFCSECGNALPGEKKNDMHSDAKKHKPYKKRTQSEKRSGKTAVPVQNVHADESQYDDGYDGYYDDILPMDEGRQREGIDPSIIKKIAILIGCLAVVIGACVALMYLL